MVLIVGQVRRPRGPAFRLNRSEAISMTTQSSGDARPTGTTTTPTCRPACPACGGPLMEIRAKLQCADCHTICETCCEGGRG
jgi:hypothetical protein